MLDCDATCTSPLSGLTKEEIRRVGLGENCVLEYDQRRHKSVRTQWNQPVDDVAGGI